MPAPIVADHLWDRLPKCSVDAMYRHPGDGSMACSPGGAGPVTIRDSCRLATRRRRRWRRRVRRRSPAGSGCVTTSGSRGIHLSVTAGIGGLLFAYDTDVISATLLFIQGGPG